MRFFAFSLFLLLLFDGPQGSTLPSKRSLGELNTTLKTNIDGAYQKINPCTQKKIQSTSCVGSHEFSHYVNGENWSDYSQKCSAIIKSFLQAIGNLLRFDNAPNGTFNIHINTSITHKNGCDSKEGQSRRSIPTIIIEATGCEVPPLSCNSTAEKEKNSQINTSQQSAKGQRNSGESNTRKPILTWQGENTSVSEGSKTGQSVTEIIEIPAQDRTSENQAGRFQGKKSLTLENVTPTGTVKTVLPLVPQRSHIEITKAETSEETFTEISKLEQNSGTNEPPNGPTTQSNANYVTNSLTLLPEDKFTSPALPQPDSSDLENPSGFAPNIPKEKNFVPPTIPQPTTVAFQDRFIPNPYPPAPVGMDQPPNDNSRQLFNDELGGQAPVNQQSANFFPSPNQISVTNLPSTDSSNAFTDETQLERPFAYPVASSLGEPQPVELPFSKSPLPPQAPAAGPPAPVYPKHFQNQLRTTTPFPPTMVKPEFDELPGQGLVTRPPVTENDFFNRLRKPFPHDQRPELQTPLPLTQTPVINPDYVTYEGSQGLTTETLPVNHPAHRNNVAFASKDSSKFSADSRNNRNQPNRPRIFHDNHPTRTISQPHQQFATETVNINRFPVNTLPKSAFGSKFREKPGISYLLNSSEHLAIPKTQTPPPQFTASPQTPPEPFPQPTTNFDIPQPEPTLPFEDKTLTTPAPEMRSSVEETSKKDAVTPNSANINLRIPAPFTPSEPQLKSPFQVSPVVLPQPHTGHLNNAQHPRTTTPEPSNTVAQALTSSFDYDYHYPNYEGFDYDYPVHQFPNSTSKHQQNPKRFVYRQFYPRAHAPFRKLPPNFFPRQHPMRNSQMWHHPRIRSYKNNTKFINTTLPEYQAEYEYEYMDGMPDYDYPEYPQLSVNAPHRRFPPNFFPQRHRIRNLKGTPFPPHLEKSFGIPISVERTPMSGLNPTLQHNINGRKMSDFINSPNMMHSTAGVPPNGTLPPEEFQTTKPLLTTTAYENKTLTTEFQITAKPEHHPPLEPVHGTAEGTQQVLDHREPNFNQPELQLGGTTLTAQTFPPGQSPMRNFETPQPQPVARKFENETISADIQITTEPNYPPSVKLENQNVRDKWVGQVPESYNPGHQVPNGAFLARQPLTGGAPFHRGFPVHQQPIRNFRPIFTPETPENKSQFQSIEKPEFDNQFINRMGPGEISNSHFAGQVQNSFDQPQPQLRSNAYAVHQVGWVPPLGEQSSRNLEIDQPSLNPQTLENKSRITVQPEFQPEKDPQNSRDGKGEKIPDSHFTKGHVQNIFDRNESSTKVNEPVFPLVQQHNFRINQPGFPTYENDTVTVEFQTTVRPEYQPPAEPINQHIDGKQILPSLVSDFKGHQAPNSDQSQLLMKENRRPGQINLLKQQPMNFEVPQSRRTSDEEKTISRDFETFNEHHHLPHEEHGRRHIENTWTAQRPNLQFREPQVPNTFPQPRQQFKGGVFPAEQQPMRILKNIQPQFSTAAYEGFTTVVPEYQSLLEPHQSASPKQQTQGTQNLGPESNSQHTKSPSGEFPLISSSKQDQERDFQISQPRPISGRTSEEGTFKTAPRPSHENATDRIVSDFAEQQNRDNFDQSQLNAPPLQFPTNIFPKPMETSETLQSNIPAQPTQGFQAPVNYNRKTPNFPFRNLQNPRRFHQPSFQPKPNAIYNEFLPNFFSQQHPMRNIEMGSPRRIHKNETIMTEIQKTEPEIQNYENDFANDRKPDHRNHNFINQQNPNESQVRAHFRRFPQGMHQTDRHNGPSFVKRPPMEFPPSRGLSGIPESVPDSFSDTRTANWFLNPSNNNEPVVNRNNFQPETALIQSDRNLDYDIPTSFYSSRPTPNENQPELHSDLIPGVRTSDEHLSTTSSDETNTTSPLLSNTSVDYEDEENVPLAVSPYLGQVLNDNMTTAKPNTSALYSEQITPIISSPRWQPPADISTFEYKNSLYSQPPLTHPKPLEVLSTSESTEQAFGGDQPPVIPMKKEFPSEFSANPHGNPARSEETADILEKPMESNNLVSMPPSNSFVPRGSTNTFSLQHQNQQFLKTPGNRPLVNPGTPPPPHIDTTTTTFEQVTSEIFRNGNIPLKSLTNPQPISVGGPQKLSSKTFSPATPFIPSKQLPAAIENPLTVRPLIPNQFSGPPKDFPDPVDQSVVRSVSRPLIPTPLNFNPPELQKPFEKRNLHIDRPHPLALGPPNHPIPSLQPIYQHHHNQPQNLSQAQRTLQRNFNLETQEMAILSQQLRKPEVSQQLSGIPPLNHQLGSKPTAELQKMELKQLKWDVIGTTAFPPQSQPQDVRFSQPTHQNSNSGNSFVTPVNQQSIAVHLNRQSSTQISSDVSRTQIDSFIQAGSKVEPQSVISGANRQPPEDFNLLKTPSKPIPAASPQLFQNSTVVKTTPKTSNQHQFDVHQSTSKFHQTPSSKLTTATYEEVTTTTDSPQPTYYSGIPVQLFKSPVNQTPTKFPEQIGNPDFIYSELPPPVTEAISSQVSPPYVNEINPTPQTNFESQYDREKFSTNFPPPVFEPQPQLTIQDYKTMERPVLKLKPKTLAIAGLQNQEDFTNTENSNRQLQATLNIPSPTPSPSDQQYLAATSLKTSEMAYNPIVPPHEKHDRQPAQDNLKFIDNSPQSQPTTAVKYSEKIQTAEYKPSPLPRPQPQTTLNNSGRQTKDNSANVWADQQQITEFGVTPPMTYNQVPLRNLKNINTQSDLPLQHSIALRIDSQNHRTTPERHVSKTTETYEQDIIDSSHRQTPQPILILGDKVSPRKNPLYNQNTAIPRQSIRHETTLNSNQQIATIKNDHTLQLTESQLTNPNYQTTPSSPNTYDHPAPLPTPESIYSGQNSLVLVSFPHEHSNSETSEEVFINQKTATVPPVKQSVTKIPETIASVEHKSVTLVRHPPKKLKIVEEIVTTELPKNILNSPVSTQLAFAEKLLNYENKKLSKLQQVSTPSPVVESNYSSTLPAGSSSNSEQISNRQVVFGENAFPKNFEKDNKQLEGSSPFNHVSISTPQRPQKVILDNPTSSFDDYDQQHSTRSPDMFPEYDEIPPNARTGLSKGHPNERSHVTFPMQPSAAFPQLPVNSRRTTPIPNDSLTSKTRNYVRQTAEDTIATTQSGFPPSISTPFNLQDHPAKRFTSFSTPDGSLVRSMIGGKKIQPFKEQVRHEKHLLEIKTF